MLPGSCQPHNKGLEATLTLLMRVNAMLALYAVLKVLQGLDHHRLLHLEIEHRLQHIGQVAGGLALLAYERQVGGGDQQQLELLRSELFLFHGDVM